MVKMTYADGTAVEYVYDVHDNITHTTDPAGSDVNSTYDLLGRLTAKTIAPGPGVSDDTTFENYKYDGISRQVNWATGSPALIQAAVLSPALSMNWTARRQYQMPMV
jgi:YD repeat-containing protein